MSTSRSAQQFPKIFRLFCDEKMFSPLKMEDFGKVADVPVGLTTILENCSSFLGRRKVFFPKNGNFWEIAEPVGLTTIPETFSIFFLARKKVFFPKNRKFWGSCRGTGRLDVNVRKFLHFFRRKKVPPLECKHFGKLSTSRSARHPFSKIPPLFSDEKKFSSCKLETFCDSCRRAGCLHDNYSTFLDYFWTKQKFSHLKMENCWGVSDELVGSTSISENVSICF